MDFDSPNEFENSKPFEPAPEPENPSPAVKPATPSKQTIVIQQPKKGSFWKIFFGLILIMSICANFFFLLIIIAIGAIGATGGVYYQEEPLNNVMSSEKIAVIRLEGFIGSQLSSEVAAQLDIAASDKNVKAVIIRTVTPGGSVSASDQIHNQISRFKQKTGKPVVAFMQSIATSGGYYTSVSCDHIAAEPTVITGSIGVIMSSIVIRDLLEEKLGIEPVVLKSGPKKDWPSMYSKVTEEQRRYLEEKVIQPAFNRFVKLVHDGRKHKLTMARVRELADGSIYTAQEALGNNLIDSVGYFDSAVSTAESLAGISNARVVEYRKPFSLPMMLAAKQNSGLKIDKEVIHQWQTPELLYIWDVNN